MKKYDYEKAKKLIEQYKVTLDSADIGMQEDWFWTGETIWKNGEFEKELTDDTKLGGINASSWATPVVRLYFKDGSERVINCYTGESDRKMDLPFFGAQGALSGPCQESVPPINSEE